MRATVVALTSLVGIFLLEHMHRELPDLLNCGACIWQLIMLYVNLIPGFLTVCLPVSIFISCMFGVGKLCANGEITAMRISGMSIFGITKYLWLCGIGVSGILFLLNGSVIPACDDRAQKIMTAIKLKNCSVAQNNLRFNNLNYDNRVAGRLWLIGSLDADSKQIANVVIHFYGSSGEDTHRICADSGYYSEGHWKLYNIRNTSFYAKNKKPITQFLPENDFHDINESPELFILAQRPVRNLSISMVKKILNHLQPNDFLYTTYATRYYTIIAGCWSPLIVLICAIPFSICRRKTALSANASKAIFQIFLFYVSANMCQALGISGCIPAQLAAWLPNGLFALVGGVFLWKVR
jgi:lipopolysaccharide export system permease protein